MGLKLPAPPRDSVNPDPRQQAMFYNSLFRLLTLEGSATVNVGLIAAGAVATFTIPVIGARADAGMTVMLGPPSTIEAGLGWHGFISADNVVTARVHNTTGAGIDPASARWDCRVMP